jgi:hypothetical protein
MPDDFTSQLPEDMRDQLTYDASDQNAQHLSFAGVMTLEEQQTLKAIIALPTEFKDAVDALFGAPRAFFRRNLQTVMVPDFTTASPQVPGSVKIPSSSSKKMFYDASTGIFYDASTGLLHVRGAMTDEEHTALLEGADPVADNDYIDAVNKLFAMPDIPIPDSDSNKLLNV